MKKRGLKVYILHSRKTNYNEDLYLPLLRSRVLSYHTLVMSTTEKLKDTYYKTLIDDCDLVVAELSHPDMGFNMELKEAIVAKKPILPLANKEIGYDDKYNKLLKNIVGYADTNELVYFVETFVNNYADKINEGKVDPTVVIGVLNLDNVSQEEQ